MAARQLLARATESTAAPTPGYLYKDLTQAASTNPSACAEMAQYLTQRLATKANPNIKYKCLKVIAKLCEGVPRNQFRRAISQNPHGVGAIKDALNFRGPLDAVRGDEPNQKVRAAAQEALDAVYREAATSEVAHTQSYGGPGISSSYAPSPHHHSRMTGMGNPRYTDPRLEQSSSRYVENANLKAVVREAGEVIAGMIKDPLARNIEVGVPRQGHSGNLPGYGNPNPYAGRPPPGSAELARQTGGQWTMASNRGPVAVPNPREQEYYKARDTSYNWAQQSAHPTAASSGGVGGSWGQAGHSTPSVTITSAPGVPSVAAGAAASDGTYEKNLIAELCPPGGMKAVPPPDKLSTFAKTVSSLNSDLICPVLLDNIEEGQPWIIRAKALCVMETCVQYGGRPDGSNPYLDFFYACQDEIAPLAVHPRQAIKDPARRLLGLMGADVPEGGQSGAPPVAAPPVAAAPNLLDFDDEPAPPASPAAQPSLFGGMQLKSPAATSPAPAPPANDAGSLLDFQSPAPAPPSNDIFRDVSVKQNGSAPPTSMFDAMNLKDNGHSNEDKKTDSEDAGDLTSMTSPSGSAFGFINQSTPKDSAAAAAETAPPAPASFDPLSNFSPNTAQKKMMTMSPEQMQAMAYQQMMMQQQMQQMQRVYAMQHGGGGMPMMPGYAMPQRMSGPAPPGGFSFLPQQQPVKKDDKKFDFVKDAMAASKK